MPNVQAQVQVQNLLTTKLVEWQEKGKADWKFVSVLASIAAPRAWEDFVAAVSAALWWC